MNTHTMTLTQIREVGLSALMQALGPVGMVRFLQQFEMGQANYTEDRKNWLLESDVNKLANKIQQNRHSDKG